MMRLIALPTVTIVLLLLLLWLGQRRLMYYPSDDVVPPAAVGLLRAEEVSFLTEDGLGLQAWFVPATTTGDGTPVIVFNGNAGNRSYRADLAAGLADAGFAVLLFDYRGYGGNQGSPSERGLTMDARAARRYLDSRADVRRDRVVYFGESLGSALAVSLAVDEPPHALVLRSPFTSMVETARHHFPFLPVNWLIRDRYESISLISRIRCPVLVIAAAHDSVVPTTLSRKLFEAAPEPKRLLIIEQADHNDEALVSGPRVIAAVKEFVRGPR